MNFEENLQNLNFNNQKKKPEELFAKLPEYQDKNESFPDVNPFMPTTEMRTESATEILNNINEPAPIIGEEENDSEDEGIEDYKLGGYHPVHIG